MPRRGGLDHFSGYNRGLDRRRRDATAWLPSHRCELAMVVLGAAVLPTIVGGSVGRLLANGCIAVLTAVLDRAMLGAHTMLNQGVMGVAAQLSGQEHQQRGNSKPRVGSHISGAEPHRRNHTHSRSRTQAQVVRPSWAPSAPRSFHRDTHNSWRCGGYYSTARSSARSTMDAGTHAGAPVSKTTVASIDTEVG